MLEIKNFARLILDLLNFSIYLVIVKTGCQIVKTGCHFSENILSNSEK